MSPTATATSIVVERRFNGPLDSANGGYACGVVARLVDGPAEVSLRRPVPLDAPLDAERHADGSVTLHHGGELLAEGGPALPLDHVVPRHRPTLEEARRAMGVAWTNRPPLLARCYVCSDLREDGLGLHFGPVSDAPEVTAAVLVPGADVPVEDGAVAPEIAWAALDCPSYTAELWADSEPSLLARMTAELLEPLTPGEPVVVTGWTLRREGRKHWSATALLGPDGRVLARAEALWIRLRPAG